MRLSEHFTLEELTISQTAARKGIHNAPTGVIVDNLTRLCVLLEDIRAVLGRPITISSGYRGPALNEAIGGAKSSQHCLGCAADILIPGMRPDDVVRAIQASDMPYDQLIREYDRWTHVSVPNDPHNAPRKQILIIDNEGTRAYGA